MQWSDWPPRSSALLPAFEAWRSGELGAAYTQLSAWVQKAPDDADGWRGLGNVHWSAAHFEQALACYTRALHIEPANPMHWGNLGLALRDLARRDAAIAAFEVALALDPDYAPALNELANVQFDLGRYAQALPLYDQSLAIDGSRAVVYHNKGVCLRHLGRLPEAIAWFQAALRIDPHYRYSQAELAACFATSAAASFTFAAHISLGQL